MASAAVAGDYVENRQILDARQWTFRLRVGSSGCKRSAQTTLLPPTDAEDSFSFLSCGE